MGGRVQQQIDVLDVDDNVDCIYDKSQIEKYCNLIDSSDWVDHLLVIGHAY